MISNYDSIMETENNSESNVKNINLEVQQESQQTVKTNPNQQLEDNYIEQKNSQEDKPPQQSEKKVRKQTNKNSDMLTKRKRITNNEEKTNKKVKRQTNKSTDKKKQQETILKQDKNLNQEQKLKDSSEILDSTQQIQPEKPNQKKKRSKKSDDTNKEGKIKRQKKSKNIDEQTQKVDGDATEQKQKKIRKSVKKVESPFCMICNIETSELKCKSCRVKCHIECLPPATSYKFQRQRLCKQCRYRILIRDRKNLQRKVKRHQKKALQIQLNPQEDLEEIEKNRNKNEKQDNAPQTPKKTKSFRIEFKSGSKLKTNEKKIINQIMEFKKTQQIKFIQIKYLFKSFINNFSPQYLNQSNNIQYPIPDRLFVEYPNLITIKPKIMPELKTHPLIPNSVFLDILKIWNFFESFWDEIDGPDFSIEELYVSLQYNDDQKCIHLINDIHIALTKLFLANFSKKEYEQSGFLNLLKYQDNQEDIKNYIGMIWPEIICNMQSFCEEIFEEYPETVLEEAQLKDLQTQYDTLQKNYEDNQFNESRQKNIETQRHLEKIQIQIQKTELKVSKFHSRQSNLLNQQWFKLHMTQLLGQDQENNTYWVFFQIQFVISQNNVIFVQKKQGWFYLEVKDPKFMEFYNSLNLKGQKEKKLHDSLTFFLESEFIDFEKTINFQSDRQKILDEVFDYNISRDAKCMTRKGGKKPFVLLEENFKIGIEIQVLKANVNAIDQYFSRFLKKRKQVYNKSDLLEQIQNCGDYNQFAQLFSKFIESFTHVSEQVNKSQDGLGKKTHLKIWGLPSENIKQDYETYIQTIQNASGLLFAQIFYVQILEKYVQKKMDQIKEQEYPIQKRIRRVQKVNYQYSEESSDQNQNQDYEQDYEQEIPVFHNHNTRRNKIFD